MTFAEMTLEDGLLTTVVAIVVVSIAFIGLQVRKESRRLHRKEKRLCQRCGYDLRGQCEDCPECGLPVQLALAPVERPLNLSKLESDWPVDAIDPRTPELGELRVVIHSSWNSREVTLVAEQLEARGVWCRVESQQVTNRSGAVVYTNSVYAAVVLQEDEAHARAILDRFRVAPPSDDDDDDASLTMPQRSKQEQH